jgi:hypothetical protein
VANTRAVIRSGAVGFIVWLGFGSVLVIFDMNSVHFAVSMHNLSIGEIPFSG